MQLDRAWLLAHLPHQNNMCLLDQVDGWDSEHIRCRASSHRDHNNPLLIQDRLGVACGIEYAAQAMAAHGALLSTADYLPNIGYLASVRNVDFYVQHLHKVSADLSVEAQRISGDDNVILYDFRITAADQLLLSGRATVVLNAT